MSNSVLISNLSPSIDASTLEDMFSIVGNVRSATVQMNADTGLSQGFAVVEMSTADEARDCVLHFNGQKKEGCTLMVREDKPHVPKAEAKSAVRKQIFKKAVGAVKRQTSRRRI